jgi:hypothetical protein
MRNSVRRTGRRALALVVAWCALALTVVSGPAAPAAAQTVVPTGNPVGFLDQAVNSPSGVIVAGWALDPDTKASVDVHVYRNGAFLGSVKASGSRPDVGAAYPAWGTSRGFSLVAPTAQGLHRFCAYAINVGAGSPYVELGCRAVQVDHDPFGWLDHAQRVPGSTDLSIWGWALDPDSAAPIAVHVYLDGVFVGERIANGTRRDIGSQYWWSDGRAGFELRVPAGEGVHSVCAYAIGVGTGRRWTGIGCRTVVVTSAPIGVLEQARVGDNAVRVTGWALDLDSIAPVAVHYYVDGFFSAAVTADVWRTDVAAGYPAWGGAHGFAADLWLWPGARRVCAFAINIGPGPAYVELGCKDLDPMPPAASGTGRRIVYANLSQRLWLVGDDGFVDRTYPISGKYLDPPPGVYRVYAYQRFADAGHDGITMEYFVAFNPAGLGYGFHTIPVDADGVPLQSEDELGFFRSAGCVRQKWSDAVFLWNWSRYGDPVVVLAR